MDRFSRMPMNGAPPVYRPNPRAVASPPALNKPGHPQHIQQKAANQFRLETRPAPPVYRPQQAGRVGVQAKATGNLIPASPAYRPSPAGSAPVAQRVPSPLAPLPESRVQALKSGWSPAPPANHRNLPHPINPGWRPNLSILQLSKKGKGDKEKKKPERKILTRILHPDQLRRKNIGTNTTRRSAGSFRRNLPAVFTPLGSHTSTYSGLFSFMRKYGGAGFMGFHTDPQAGLTRAEVLLSVLRHMRQKRETTSSRGPKFAIVAIDASRLQAGSVLDLNSEQHRREFSRNYSAFSNMYNNHAREGVVAVKDSIRRDAVVALRAFRDVPEDEEAMQEIIDALMAEAEDEHESFTQPPFRKDDDEGAGGGGGGFNTGIEVS